jgi:hypothetical protein
MATARGNAIRSAGGAAAAIRRPNPRMKKAPMREHQGLNLHLPICFAVWPAYCLKLSIHQPSSHSSITLRQPSGT